LPDADFSDYIAYEYPQFAGDVLAHNEHWKKRCGDTLSFLE
jgi:hypothetical protein